MAPTIFMKFSMQGFGRRLIDTARIHFFKNYQKIRERSSIGHPRPYFYLTALNAIP